MEGDWLARLADGVGRTRAAGVRPAVNGRGYNGGAPSMGLDRRTFAVTPARFRGRGFRSPTALAWGGSRRASSVRYPFTVRR